MKSKKLKAFTLVELIVSIAIFGIIMAAVVRLMDPINDIAKSSGARSNQKTVENAIVSYIGENIRYATNLGIYSGKSSASDAIDDFFNQSSSILNVDGTVADNSDANKKNVNVIAFTWDGGGSGLYDSTDTGIYYQGRLFRSLSGNATQGFANAMADTDSYGADGTKGYYMGLGKAFYGAADYSLTVTTDGDGVELKCYSTYYYNTTVKDTLYSAADTSTNTGTHYTYSGDNPTVGYYQLRNKNLGGLYYADASAPNISKGSTGTIYFVYTLATDDSGTLTSGGTASGGNGLAGENKWGA